MSVVDEAPYPWQERLWQELLRQHREGRLPHALLFTGIPGLGKLALAQALGHRLLCREPQGERACGHCRSCQLLAAASHPDFLRVAPAEAGKPITVDQIRELTTFQSLSAQYGEHKVIVLEPADRLNLNAANALLKTLEEPTPGTTLLLVTARPARLLATVRSRCQQLAQPPAGTAGETWLADQLADPAAASHLMGLSGGAPLAALAMARDGGLELEAERFAEFEAMAQGELDPLAVAEGWQKGEVEQTLEWLYRWVAEMIRLESGGGSNDAGRQGRLRGLADTIDLKALHGFLIEVGRALQLSATTVNSQLLLEELLLKWPRPRRTKTRSA